MTILDELAAYARVRVQKAKETVSLEEMKERALNLTMSSAYLRTNTGQTHSAQDYSAQTQSSQEHSAQEHFAQNHFLQDRPAENAAPFQFEKALSGPDMGFICEVKKASPSKGLIAEAFPYVEIAKEYEQAGAECISVLTEPKWFLGSGEYLREITESVRTPCIRKDFTVDEYMIYEAKVLGASAVLLICSLLDTKTLEAYIRIADSLGLSALVEAHDEEEIRSAAAAGARMIGVNNRNLKDFTVDVHNSERLRKLVPDGILFVAESGIRGPEDVRAMREAGADACLVGETLMRAKDKAAMLERLRSG